MRMLHVPSKKSVDLLLIGCLLAFVHLGCDESSPAKTEANLEVIPTTLTFSGDMEGDPPTSQTIAISSTGITNLGFSCAESEDWLTIAPGSGTTPTEVAVQV